MRCNQGFETFGTVLKQAISPRTLLPKIGVSQVPLDPCVRFLRMKSTVLGRRKVWQRQNTFHINETACERRRFRRYESCLKPAGFWIACHAGAKLLTRIPICQQQAGKSCAKTQCQHCPYIARRLPLSFVDSNRIQLFCSPENSAYSLQFPYSRLHHDGAARKTSGCLR